MDAPDRSPFALFELDANRCQWGWIADTSLGVAHALTMGSHMEPVLAWDDKGFELGAKALRQRARAPQNCVLDLLLDPGLEGESARQRQARWPFAPRVLREDHSVAWSIAGRQFPRAWLLSRFVVQARIEAEAALKVPVRSMALLACRSLSGALHQDLETAAELAGFERVWWVDRVHALAYALRMDASAAPTDNAQEKAPDASALEAAAGSDGEDTREGEATEQGDEAEPGEEAKASDRDEISGESQAEGSAAEVEQAADASAPDDASGESPAAGDAAEVDKTQAALDKTDASAGSKVDHADAALAQIDAALGVRPLDQDAQDAAEDVEPATQDSAPKLMPMDAVWLWSMGSASVELATVKLRPTFEISSRSILAKAHLLPWQDRVVAQMLDDLQEDLARAAPAPKRRDRASADEDPAQSSMPIESDGLAMVRLWDASQKMMGRLEKEAQTTLHLPHICAHEGKSLHVERTWTRRRMDAQVKSASDELRERCGSFAWPEDAQYKVSARYGEKSEMPVWTRAYQQAHETGVHKLALSSDAALRGAAQWVRERLGHEDKTLLQDRMVGNLEWVHEDSGQRVQVPLQGQCLPLTEEIDLQGPAIGDTPQRWTLYHCLGSSDAQDASAGAALETFEESGDASGSRDEPVFSKSRPNAASKVAAPSAEDESAVTKDASASADAESRSSEQASTVAEDASASADEESKSSEEESAVAGEDASASADTESKSSEGTSAVAEGASASADKESKSSEDASASADKESKSSEEKSRSPDEEHPDETSLSADAASESAKTSADQAPQSPAEADDDETNPSVHEAPKHPSIPLGPGLRVVLAKVEFMPSKVQDHRVRMQVQRQGKVTVSRSPSARNAGAPELVHRPQGLSQDQRESAVLAQKQQDRSRFLQMKADAMQELLADNCAKIEAVLQERGEKMDDVLRTQVSEWRKTAKEALAAPGEDASDHERGPAGRLQAMTPSHSALLELLETLSRPQIKTLGLASTELPELPEDLQSLRAEPGRVSVQPYWSLGR